MTISLKTIFFTAALAVLFIHCAKNEAKQSANRPQPAPQTSEREADQAKMDAYARDAEGSAENTISGNQTMSTAAGRLSFADSTRTIARTADLRFRSRQILHTTLEIENIVRRNGGFFLQNNLTNEVLEKESWPINSDSCRETTRVQAQNHLVFRVPVAQLDTTLRALGRFVDFLDYRRVMGEDFWLRNLETELTRLRQENHTERLEEIPEKGKSLRAIAELNEQILRSETASDAAKIEALRIKDAVQLSTVTIDLYAYEMVLQNTVANTAIADRPHLPFGQRLAAALLSGWSLLESLLMGIISIWSLLLLGALAWFFIKKYRKGALAWKTAKANS